MYTSKKFLKEIRPKASVLISYVADSGFTREAWKTYYDWLNEKITYKQALSKLKKLAKHRNKKKRQTR